MAIQELQLRNDGILNRQNLQNSDESPWGHEMTSSRPMQIDSSDEVMKRLLQISWNLIGMLRDSSETKVPPQHKGRGTVQCSHLLRCRWFRKLIHLNTTKIHEISMAFRQNHLVPDKMPLTPRTKLSSTGLLLQQVYPAPLKRNSLV